ncbi:PadR family transcriptional regulator [Curtobacterium caseinilyticum]|uniref:PadR family transcriptional regulator n=1 Tax=Curtobacterium caseinilyticum TaxID=3055137 RepID=A0ABT7TP25_9MICO|nr:PadR family transcriptional regulator [Curtobacterium caseinilyticum]MDM7891355.1 PadR family transcriptional regulator [Curtobacterium caseinilyticum]
MSPVFAHGALRLSLLSMLADRPMHGYELIQALGERFGGAYVPSAGTVYPRLAKLEAEGLVTKTVDGRKTVYAITDAGRAELDARAEELAAIQTGVADSVKSLADGVRASVGEAMRSLRADLAASAQAPRGQTADEPVDVPTAGAGALREVEMVIASFRQQVRADLRRRATRGTLTEDTVTRLRDGLEALRRSV